METITKLTPAEVAMSKFKGACQWAAWRGVTMKPQTFKAQLMQFSSYRALAAFLLGTEWREKFLG